MGAEQASGVPVTPLRASAVALLVRLLLLGSGAVTGVLLPLCLTQTSVGLYFLAQSLVGGLATVAQLGLSITVPALMSDALGRRDPGAIRAVSERGLWLGLGAAVAVAAIFVLSMSSFAAAPSGLRLVAADGAAGTSSLAGLAPWVGWIAATMLAGTMATLVAEQLRVLGRHLQAGLLAAGGSLAASAMLLTHWWWGRTLPLTELLAAGLVGLVLGVAWGGVTLRRWLLAWQVRRSAQPAAADLLRGTAANWGTTLVLFGVSQIDVWLVAWFRTPADVAVYGLASRLAALVLIPLAAINSVVAPSIAAVWARGKRRFLGRMLSTAAAAATLAAIAGYLGFLVLGGGAVRLVWGESYGRAFGLFAVLGIAQVVQSFAGSAGYVLMMLNRQGVAMRIACLIGLWLVVAGAWATAAFGVWGMAAVYALAGIAQPLLMAMYVRRHFGVDPTASSRSALRLARAFLRKVFHHDHR